MFQGSRSSESSYSNWKLNNMGSRKSVDNMFNVYYRSGLLKPGKSQHIYHIIHTYVRDQIFFISFLKIGRQAFFYLTLPVFMGTGTNKQSK